MRHDDMRPRSKAPLHELDDMRQRRRGAAIDRVKGTRVKVYFAGKAAADAPDTTCPGSQLYIQATIAGWKWMQSELLVPYHFTVRLIEELQSCGYGSRYTTPERTVGIHSSTACTLEVRPSGKRAATGLMSFLRLRYTRNTVLEPAARTC